MFRFVIFVLSFGFLAFVLASGAVVGMLWHYGKELPEYKQLANYEPPVMTRVHAGDGALLAEFATEHRIFVPIAAIPQAVIQAFLSAEDKNFYQHPGIDFTGIARAVIINVKNIGKGRRPVGASTITQQVAKNFLLSSEVSVTRKFKEAIMSFRLERAFSKQRILELYLNEIYLGRKSYGVAAAALNYFDKFLDELTLAEVAYLAALPKAPNNYHPERRRKAAIARRNWVIGRMKDDGKITQEMAAAALALDLGTRPRKSNISFRADYFVEAVRRELVDRYGEKGLYEGGLSVRSTLEPTMQAAAETALRGGLLAYDRRHGWRGPFQNVEIERGDWQTTLAKVEVPKGLGDWSLALVLDVGVKDVRIGLISGEEGHIPFAGLKWARAWKEGERLGPQIRKAGEVLKAGDLIAVSPLIPEEKTKKRKDKKSLAAKKGPLIDSNTSLKLYQLEQVPGINGGIIAIDPHTGRVLAMSGGFSHEISKYNRATQAFRQPGSAFKPLVYAAALENGFTPSTLILDAPFVLDQGPIQGKWKPTNYSKKFYGPSTLRLGIEQSRNLMTVRLAQYVGMDKVTDMARRLGVMENMPPYLPMALGAGESTLLRMTLAYAMFVNGGKKLNATFIDRIQNHLGKTVFKHDKRACAGCLRDVWANQPAPRLPDEREQVLDSATAYQIVSMLRGVVLRGTGRKILRVGKPMAGKTGTSNESKDTWFIGFSPNLAVGVYVGFDEPRSLGRREQGASAAAPIFRDFFIDILNGKPAVPFRVPRSIQLIKVNVKTGKKASRGKGVIWEAFKKGNGPDSNRNLLGVRLTQEKELPGAVARPKTGSGGLY